MGIHDEDKIDLITINPETRQTYVYILDGESWDYEECRERLLKIQNKLNRYLDAIESDELFSKFPNASRSGLALVYMYPKLPPREAEQFFLMCQTYLSENRIQFFIGLRDSREKGDEETTFERTGRSLQ